MSTSGTMTTTTTATTTMTAKNNKANKANSKADKPYYMKQGLIGHFLQAATWMFTHPFADSPSFMDNWLRCSTLSR